MVPCIVIPAYKPDMRLRDLVGRLKAAGFISVVVVDDGSGSEFKSLFGEVKALGAVVLQHAINMGKGRALKTAFNHCLAEGLAKDGLITADADGQHTPEDIAKIAEAMAENPSALVLGVRDFKGKIPLKSRFGNTLTRKLFMFINGSDVRDTQTGLRGIPEKHLPMFLTLTGERYEFEMNMLLSARPSNIKFVQIPIETIYIEGNKSSHFNAIVDSYRIYKLIFKFIFSSILATLIDWLLFALIIELVPNQVFVSVVGARVGSSLVNYAINRNIVFRQKDLKPGSMAKYYALVLVVMMLSYGFIKLFNGVLGVNQYIAKLIGDTLLYFLSFFVQREWIFKKRAEPDN